MLKKQVLVSALALAGVLGCKPDIDKQPAPGYVTVSFDPSASPPVVPTPNDLVTNPATGKLAVSLPPDASPADVELVTFLNSLDGFPTSSGASVSFSAPVEAASVTSSTIKVLDITDNYSAVTGAFASYVAPTGGAPARVSVRAPDLGWTVGHSYAIAVVGGDEGVKDEQGRPVIGTATWALLRSGEPLVDCPTEDTCAPTTGLIPATETDAAARLAQQTATAKRLEGLRLKYKPTVDALIAGGVPRENIALAWSFKVASSATFAFEPGVIPPMVPSPNDLAINRTTGLVNAPVDPRTSLAQQEFTRDYLNQLNGFPISATATTVATGVDLDPATLVLGATVRVIALDATKPATPSSVTYNAATRTVSVAPPVTGWPKGGKYAVVIVGGGSVGVTDSEGGAVIPSTPWVLVRGENSLVTCTDLTAPDCAPTIRATAMTTAEALRLEQVRLGYAPLLDTLAGAGLTRDNVALAWTFTVVNQPEVTFDPSAGLVPFPNNLLLSSDGTHVNLPNPGGDPLIAGLNTLDGFSTTAAIVSENDAARGALSDGLLGLDEIPATQVGLFNLSGGAAPVVKACVNCASTPPPTGVTNPQELQIVPQIPLDERTQYGAFVSTTLKDTTGRPLMPSSIFALIRLENSLLDADGNSTLSVISKPQATALEPLRVGMKPVIDAMVAKGIPRSQQALTWSFKTLSTVATLAQMNGLPAALSIPSTVTDLTEVTVGAPAGTRLFTGTMLMPVPVNTATGTFNTSPGSIAVQPAPFVLTVPAGASGNYPITVYGHGLFGTRNHLLLVAPALAAKGQAAIAVDTLFHGERSVCVGIQAGLGFNPCAVGTCNSTPNSPLYGRCIGVTRPACEVDDDCTGSVCAADGMCEGGDFVRNGSGVPAFSGANFLSVANLFGTRDNFRSRVPDLAQLFRVLKNPDFNTQLAAVSGDSLALNSSEIDYLGHSLGGMLGSLFSSVNPDIQRAVFNVAGGDLVGILFESPGFSDVRAGFLAGLHSQGLDPGSQAFDRTIRAARWILDAGDPINFIYPASNASTVPSTRDVLVQYIDQDQTIPNSATERLLAAANRGTGRATREYKYVPASVGEFPLIYRHTFLINPAAPTNYVTAVREQAATFLDDGSVTNPGL